jgi:hypothetical protein
MVETGSKTIDEFAFVMRTADSGRHVPIAKAVMSALFLHLERTADLGQYRRAVRSMIDFTDLALPGTGPMSVPSTAFCLDYNYDRCLPAAIYLEVVAANRGRGAETESRVHRVLNSGLDTMKERLTTVDTSRFADLKMHGMVGTSVSELGDADPVRGLILDEFGRHEATDDILNAVLAGGDEASKTMIFFPWETRLPGLVRKLIDETDRAARQYLDRVELIRAIGYSFHDHNAPRLNRLLAAASRCRVIEVYDPSLAAVNNAQSLAARMESRPKVVHYSGWSA